MPDLSFTPQKAINAARRRHGSFPSLVLDDTALVDDYNRCVDEVIVEVMSENELVLMTKSADIAFTGADGAVEDINVPAGQILKIVGMDSTKSAAVKRVVLRDFKHRETLAADYADDTKPVGFIVFNAVNNRWDLHEVINWTGVTAIQVYGVIKPAEVLTAGLTTAQTIPYQLFLPIVEKLAILMGQRADLDQAWMQTQVGKAGVAMQNVLKRFADHAGNEG